jgi:hypothetical protein
VQGGEIDIFVCCFINHLVTTTPLEHIIAALSLDTIVLRFLDEVHSGTPSWVGQVRPSVRMF